MNKEKEIEEMAEVALRSGHSNDGYIEFDYRDIAEYFYEAGYRKAEEVRKETAKEILQHMHDNLPDLKLVVKYYEEKYGVEVDE